MIRTRRKLLTWLGLLAVLSILAYQISAWRGSAILVVDDFVEYWASGRLNWIGSDPYSADQLLRMERSGGWPKDSPVRIWTPPFTLALLMPFALLPYPIGRLLWLLFGVGMIGLASRWAWALFAGPTARPWPAYAAVLLFFPTIFVLRMGQIGPILLLGVVGFLRSERNRRDGRAGAFAALLLIKPHLLYLVCVTIFVWAVSRRRWKILSGGAIAIGIGTLAAVVVNPLVIHQYTVAITDASPLDSMTPKLGTLLRLLLGPERTWLSFVPMIPGFCWLALYGLRNRHKWSWPERIPLVLLVSVITAAYSWTWDLIVATPAVIQVAHRTSVAHQTRTTRMTIGSYAIMNVGAFVQSCLTTDFELLWLPLVLLVWYLFANARMPGDEVKVGTPIVPVP